MQKKIATYFSLAIIVLFIVYIVYDTVSDKNNSEPNRTSEVSEEIVANWSIAETLEIPYGTLKSICLSDKNMIFAGGENFLAAFSKNDLSVLWNINTANGIYALSIYGDTIYAASGQTITLYNINGNFIEEWGSYDEEAIITSISTSKNLVAFADAQNKIIFVLNKDGSLKHFFGQPGNQFVVPSSYFDVSFYREDTLLVANPGKQQIEYRTISGEIISSFGEAGFDLENFCGCCNPSHFALMPDGKIVTAEKGINRIKIISAKGELIELVAQSNLFKANIPLDIAVSNDGDIYAANGYDSKLYIFKRKN